ncbi:hypothetical protein [Phytobacter sp. RSE-02]|uniref:hypothetical protein n=1 Tax=Phytobacter sp. RSE-02 TaxID=3229229 RepID=UPI00339D3E32
MADAAFILPKGVYRKNEYLFNILRMDVDLIADDNMSDTILINFMENWSMDDFSELIEALRISICREQKLTAEMGRKKLHWHLSFR